MNEWLSFLYRIVRFPARTIKNGPLLLYFIFIICMFGALGAWIPAAQIWFGDTKMTWVSVHRSLATYVIGIAITSFADCVACDREKENKTFQLFLLGLMFIGVAAAIIVLLVETEQTIVKYSYLGTLIAAILWLMVHDADPNLTKEDALSALGGKVSG